MRTYVKGSKRVIAMQVNRRKPDPFEIQEVTYKVKDSGLNVIEEGQGGIDGNTVFFLLNSVQDHYESEKTYAVYFHVKIEDLPKEIIEKVYFKIID